MRLRPTSARPHLARPHLARPLFTLPLLAALASCGSEVAPSAGAPQDGCAYAVMGGETYPPPGTVRPGCPEDGEAGDCGTLTLRFSADDVLPPPPPPYRPCPGAGAEDGEYEWVPYTEEPTAPASEEPAPGESAQVTFRPSTLAVPPPGSTHLRGGPVDAPVGGDVTLEAAGRMHLPDGRLAAGSGYEAAGGGGGPAWGTAVAGGPVDAEVTLAVVEEPDTGGARVAFVEGSLAPEAPVRWETDEALTFVTDGGDGGFWPSGAPAVEELPTSDGADDYVEALSGADSHGLCARRTAGGVEDSVLFPTGAGDGGYPVHLGRAADGRVVSAVFDSGMLPWALSGLPGTPPAGG